MRTSFSHDPAGSWVRRSAVGLEGEELADRDGVRLSDRRQPRGAAAGIDWARIQVAAGPCAPGWGGDQSTPFHRDVEANL
jgi:hypothetical protein